MPSADLGLEAVTLAKEEGDRFGHQITITTVGSDDALEWAKTTNSFFLSWDRWTSLVRRADRVFNRCAKEPRVTI
jgi:hypothetical protein